MPYVSTSLRRSIHVAVLAAARPSGRWCPLVLFPSFIRVKCYLVLDLLELSVERSDIAAHASRRLPRSAMAILDIRQEHELLHCSDCLEPEREVGSGDFLPR
jgi:hypothetical protein